MECSLAFQVRAPSTGQTGNINATYTLFGYADGSLLAFCSGVAKAFLPTDPGSTMGACTIPADVLGTRNGGVLLYTTNNDNTLARVEYRDSDAAGEAFPRPMNCLTY